MKNLKHFRHVAMTRISRAAVLAAVGALLVVPIFESSLGAAAPATSPSTSFSAAHDATTPYPVGTPDTSEPSGDAPPSATAMTGYTLRYVNDFKGTTIPNGWNVFSGKPSGDPGGQWAKSHVTVGSGLLQLNTYEDPAYGNEWVTGGVCQCGSAHTYGAYFVRSRMTGPGPTQVELLWPAAGWPPEIDFDETFGDVAGSMATLHFTDQNQQIHTSISTDMTQWHTWGVIWTPTSVTYTLDGVAWGSVTTAADIPSQPMTLDLQQQTWCSSNFACPTAPQSTEVDWVAEYGAQTSSTTSSTTTTTLPVSTSKVGPVTVTPFAANSAALSAGLKVQVAALAATIATKKPSSVTLTGYAADLGSTSGARNLGGARATTVATYLKTLLTHLNVSNVRLKIHAVVNSKPSQSNATARGRALNRRVVATLS